MYKSTKDGLEWLQFDLLSDLPHLKHAVFLRHGGYSQGAFESLNVSYSVGDKEESVKANLHRIQSYLQEDMETPIQLIWGKQCHGKQVALINSNSFTQEPLCDSLITQEPGLALTIRHADCQAAIFYDTKNHAIANVHSGWRGSVLNIYSETIQAMRQLFGSKPSELLVCISPSLGPDDAEFINYSTELPQEFWKFQVRPTYFDFWAISTYQLQQAGILPHHIEIAGISTYSNPNDYFSYRRHKITGRNATCVVLN